MSERLTAEELENLKQYYCLRFALDTRAIPSRAGELFDKLVAAAEENAQLRAAAACQRCLFFERELAKLVAHWEDCKTKELTDTVQETVAEISWQLQEFGRRVQKVLK